MQIHFGVELLQAEWPQAVVCIGTFDGVHCGHQAVIRRAVAMAKDRELPCVLVTFDRHPAAVLSPDNCPPPIASLAENLSQFAALGVSLAAILPFSAKLSRMPAEQFLNKILIQKLRAAHAVVGHDFAMGNGREGTAEWLAQRLPTEIVAPFRLEGVRVSSREIREAIQEGRIEAANAFLGRPFTIPGVVVSGQQLGRTLGYPTVNLARSFTQVMPADGIYAGRIHCAFGTFLAATSIGTRPTVNGVGRTIEAYLLDYPGDSLYGRTVALELHAYLRPELRFEGLDALVAQMALDVEATRQTMSSHVLDPSGVL